MAFQNPQVYDVRDYLAGGSLGSLNDAPFYQAAIDAMPAHGGILPIIGSRPNFETSLTINKPVNFVGGGRLDSSGRYGATVIQTSSPTATPIVVASSGVTLEKFGLCNTSNNVTDGAGILVDISQPRSVAAFGSSVQGQNNGGSFDIDKVTVFGYYNGIHVKNGIEYTLSNFQIEACRNVYLWLEHQLLPDGGDQTITGGQLVSSRYNGATALLCTSGGGPKITNVKVNGRNGIENFLNAMVFDIAQSVDVLIANCSLENFTQGGIVVKPSPVFYQVVIGNNQFYSSNCQGPIIDISGVKGIAIGVNSFGPSNNNGNVKAVSIRNCQYGYVAKQNLMNFNGDCIADRRVGMSRTSSPTVEFEGVSGTGDF